MPSTPSRSWPALGENLAALERGLADESERAAGQSPKDVKAAVTAAKAALAAAVDAADRLPVERDAITALEGQRDELAELTQQLHRDAAGHSSAAKAATVQIGRLRAKLDQLRGADLDIDAREIRLQREFDALGRLAHRQRPARTPLGVLRDGRC